MPRTAIRNARCFTSHDHPLLPFLAPRIFAESPLRKSSPRWKGTRAQEEKETVADGGDVMNKGSETCSQNKCRSAQARPTDVKKRCIGKIAPFARSSWPVYRCLHNHGIQTSTFTKGNFSESSHGGVYSGLRSQCRSYSSESGPIADTHDIDTWSGERRRRTGTRIPAPNAKIRFTGVSSTSKSIVGTPLKRRTKLSQSMPAENHLTRLRRRKALLKERERMRLYMEAIPGVVRPAALLRQARYRSLKRRILNLVSRSVGRVDLRSAHGVSGQQEMLLRGFAALDRSLYPGFQRKTHLVRIIHDPQCKEWVESLFKGSSTDDSLLANWDNIPAKDMEKSWHLILLYLLDHERHLALPFLRSLRRNPPLDMTHYPEILADSMEVLARSFVQGLDSKSVPGNGAEIVSLFYLIFKAHLFRHRAICSQDLLLNIARIASVEHFQKVFKLLKKQNAFIGYITVLHWAKIFAEKGGTNHALRCLEWLKDTRTPASLQTIVGTDVFKWTCAAVLRKSMSAPDSLHKNSEIIKRLVYVGLNMDILMYNVIMSNAMEAGDTSTAFRIYNLLAALQLEPDKFTYSILLYGCTKSDDPARFHAFAEHCAGMAKELQDPWLATDYLYYLYIRHTKDNMDTQHLCAILSQTYSRFFSQRPLGSFNISRMKKLRDFEPGTLMMDPPPIAMFIMLQVEIQNAQLVSDANVWQLYLHFKSVVAQGLYPVLNELARKPHIWTVFLLAFCQKAQFANASQVIKNMNDGIPKGTPKPDVVAWTIFMRAFFMQGHVQAAERVFEMMKGRGVEPNTIAYQSLLVGFAVAQKVERLGEIMEKMDDEAQIHPQVLQALNRVHNRKRLMMELERYRIKKEQWERTKLKLEKRREEEIWEGEDEEGGDDGSSAKPTENRSSGEAHDDRPPTEG